RFSAAAGCCSSLRASPASSAFTSPSFTSVCASAGGSCSCACVSSLGVRLLIVCCITSGATPCPLTCAAIAACACANSSIDFIVFYFFANIVICCCLQKCCYWLHLLFTIAQINY